MEPEITLPVAYGRGKNVRHWKPATVTWAELILWMGTPASKKDTEGYVLGTIVPTTRVHKPGEAPCLEIHRVKEGIESRCALTIDVDHPEADWLERMKKFPSLALMHTTFSSAPDASRYRLIIPLDRPVAPDEYITATKSMMQKLGPLEQFDPKSWEPQQFMYKPAAQQADWFLWYEYEGPVVKADDLLETFEKSLALRPMPTPSRTKRNPFEIDGVVGAFNRAYEDWDLLIEEYELPYSKVDESRYHLHGAKSEAGMGPVQGVAGLMYSHHAHDPAFGKTCSAFDLVRLHKYGDLDEAAKPQTPISNLPSHVAMLDLATTDHRVTAQLVGLDFDEVMDDDILTPDAWKLDLNRNRNGKIVDSSDNWITVRDNDAVFGCLYFNDLTMSIEADCDLPWRVVNDTNRVFRDTDYWEVLYHIERQYGTRMAKGYLDSLVETAAASRKRNPVADYLTELTWDGERRVEECLPGVEPTDFTRLVARKCMVAAVARMLDPGCKWDHTLVLFGPEGLGKSWWVDKMSRGWSSPLGKLDNKDTLLVMQRSWILLSDEGYSMRKADQDVLKDFLTRTNDVFRMPFEKETLLHPRHSVIWSTTNDEIFLRNQEGNRRFLIVKCAGQVDFDKITDHYVDQVWAEAVHLYRQGELLYLLQDESGKAFEERIKFTEEDALAGIVEEYLNRLVPGDWETMSVEKRQQWIFDRASGFVADGTEQILRVCSTQIWVEALGRRIGDHRRADLLEITNVLKKLEGWDNVGVRKLRGYGAQVTFIRKDML